MVSVSASSILDPVRPTDAIVNPANSFLNHGGGLARAIAAAAVNTVVVDDKIVSLRSVSAWNLEQENHPLIPTGAAGYTSPGLLAVKSYKGIIHAVGPIWGGGRHMEEDLLELTMTSALNLAADHGFESIACPAISCGVFGFPIERAAPILFEVASWFRHQIRTDFYGQPEARDEFVKAGAIDITPEVI